MACEVYLYRFDGYNKKRPHDIILFPFPPSTLDISDSNEIVTADLQNYGEVVLKKRKRLRTVSLSGILPSHKSTYGNLIHNYRGTKMELWELIEKIRTFKDGNYVLGFLVTGTYMGQRNTIMYCYIEEFTYSGIADGTQDVSYSLRLKEYRKEGKRPTSVPKTYKTKSGDTCTTIARKFYGASVEWRKVYANNRSKIGSNPNKIKTGTVIKL